MIGARILAVLSISMVLPASALAASKAASFLIAEQIKEMCPRGGTFQPNAIIEKDITGDGRADLVLDLGGLICKGAGNGRNDECGAAHCPVRFYVRRGELLAFDHEVTSIGVEIAAGNPPRIGLVSFEYKKHSMRWDRTKFRYPNDR